jgi:hypothetical protein
MTGTLDKFNQIQDKNVRFIYLWLVEFKKKQDKKTVSFQEVINIT